MGGGTWGGRTTHSLPLGGRGTVNQLQKVEQDSGENEAGLSAPPWDPPQVQVGSGGPEERGEAPTAGRGGLAGRGWPRKGRSLQQVPACGLKVSSGQVLCNRSHTHQPLLLRPISMLNCSLWPPGLHDGGVRTHQRRESGQGNTGTRHPPCAWQEAQTPGKR